MSGPLTMVIACFMAAAPLLLFTYFAFDRWQGGWRIAALAPSVGISLLVAPAMIEAACSDRAIGFAPIAIAMLSLLGLVLLGMIAVLHWVLAAED